jgi:hypothetical protein
MAGTGSTQATSLAIVLQHFIRSAPTEDAKNGRIKILSESTEFFEKITQELKACKSREYTRMRRMLEPVLFPIVLSAISPIAIPYYVASLSTAAFNTALAAMKSFKTLAPEVQ